MKTTTVLFNQLSTMQLGVDKLANAVKSTLGPGGRGVIIKREFMMPFITKDGVTVAQSINLKDPILDIGAQLMKEIASKTVEGAGDGTTTATLLGQAIFNHGLIALSDDVDPVEMKKGMDIAVKKVIEHLKTQAQPVKERHVVKQVAMISTNNDEQVSDLIAEAIIKIGENGYIAAEESNGVETYHRITEGMKLERGYLSPHFITNIEKMLVEYENPLILVTDKRINEMKDLMHGLELSQMHNRPLIIIAEEVEGEALATLVINKNQGRIRACAVRCPYMGGQKKILLEDIAILTGATVLSEDAGFDLKRFSVEQLGSCEKISISKDSTVIMNGGGEKADIEKRINQIKQEITDCRDENETFRLKSRLAKIDGGFAIIYVGGSTETEMRERKFRVDDAIYATIAATEEGMVPGGGVALLNCVKSIGGMILKNKDQRIGAKIIMDAIRQPIMTIIENKKGVRKVNFFSIDRRSHAQIIMDRIALNSSIEKSYGWNARTEEFGSMYDMGIVDPTKVVRLALENASSIVGLLLNTKATIYENPEKLPPVYLEKR